MNKIIKISGVLTFDDYLSAQTLAAKKTRLVFRAILISIGVTCLFFPADGNLNIILKTIAFVFLIYGIFLSPLQFRYRVRRNWDNYPAIQDRLLQNEYSVEGLRTNDDAGQAVFTKWSNMTGWCEDDTTLLIYFSPELYHVLPKRFLDNQEQLILTNVLSEKFGKPL